MLCTHDQAQLLYLKDFDCGLGGGKQLNCVRETKEVDGVRVTVRNCGETSVVLLLYSEDVLYCAAGRSGLGVRRTAGT